MEIYCDRVRDLGEAYMSQGERAVHGLKTTSDVYQKMKLVRSLVLRRKYDLTAEHTLAYFIIFRLRKVS